MKKLKEWIDDDVASVRGASVPWLSQFYFFRDPTRPVYADASYFLSPADGVILYQCVVEDDGHLIDIKGRSYSLPSALRDPTYARRSLVIGIFMTFYDVHVNRIPYSGRLTYRECEAIDTLNRPMLGMEKSILEDLCIELDEATYLRRNQRVVNRIDAPDLGQSYYVLQVADYDVDCITPFTLKQNQPVLQGERFSQIRYGSQVDLIVPLSPAYDFEPLVESEQHVEAGNDALIRIVPKH